MRQEFDDGFYVLYFRKLFDPPSLGDDPPPIVQGSLPSDHIWMHLGLLYEKPIRPTFELMSLAHYEIGDGHVYAPKRVLLNASYHEYTLYQAVSLLTAGSGWALTFYRIKSSCRPIAHFIPGHNVPAERETDPKLIWLPPGADDAAHGPGVAGALEDGGGAPDDEDENNHEQEGEDLGPGEQQYHNHNHNHKSIRLQLLCNEAEAYSY